MIGRQSHVDTATRAPEPVVVFDNVAITYDRVPVLEQVDGVVRSCRAVALIGPNGAGKSTVIKAILGLVHIHSGSIKVLDQSPSAARREVGYVPQADSLDPDFPISVRDVVLMGRYRHIGWLRRASSNDRRIAADALAQVGLTHRAKDRFGALSGGQRQRVLLARAIAQQPRLLLLDEPFNGVDMASQDALLRSLTALKSRETAIVISTHDLSFAEAATRSVL